MKEEVPTRQLERLLDILATKLKETYTRGAE
jgi:hypothetical protein